MLSEVVIASLLHDIGKLLQRAENKNVYHGQIGCDYLKTKGFSEEILEAVYYHHGSKLHEKINANSFKNEFLTELVYEADNIAAKNDRRENIDSTDAEKWDKTSALKSVFSYLNTKSDKTFVYPVRDLNTKNNIIYPLSQNEIIASQDRYMELKKIIDDNLDSEITPNSLLELLESTLTYVTSSTNTEENLDISLFDHSKITAAVASCIYQYFDENSITDYREKLVTNPNREEKYYLLVSGDISGIQDFIYTISSKGALKSLRARSFYLELMLEHIVDEILSELGMYRCNLLYTGGGHFYMLLANTEKTKAVIQKAQEKINDWFIKEFGENLYIAIAYTEASSNDLQDTREIYKSVSQKLSKEKLSRYTKTQLKELISPHKNVSARECVICKTSSKSTNVRKFIDSDLNVCDTCYLLLKIGENLVKDNLKLTVSKNKTENSIELPSVNGEAKYLTFTTSDSTKDADRVYVINDRKIGDKYATKLFAGNYCYKNSEGKTANFEELLEDNKGIKRLAVLRCDVDNLGQTFISGLPEGYSTLSRTSTLSRQLSLFFKFYINNICHSNISGEAGVKLDNFTLDGGNTTDDKHLTIVYSGGDDVFIVGAWLDVLNFAFDLRESFKKYTCNKLTFSGGIGFFSARYPISQMASQTAELEDAAKKYDNSKKDAVSLFGKAMGRDDTYHWDEFKEKVYDKIRLIYKWCYFDEKEPVKDCIMLSTSMMYKIKQLLIQNDDKKFNIARLAYTLARMKPAGLNDNEVLAANWTDFKRSLYNWSQSDSKSFLTALDLIIYLNRNEGDNG